MRLCSLSVLLPRRPSGSRMHGLDSTLARQPPIPVLAGSMQAMMKKMPFGGGGSISDEQLREGELKLKRFGAFVELMSVAAR